MEEIRINKYLAECGVCSRREADRLIGQGRVEIEGKTARSGQRIAPGTEVWVDGREVKRQERLVLAFHKPVGVTCTRRDPHAERTITDVVKLPDRVTYAGRLDRASEGLLLLTNDGDLIEAMMRGSRGHEKEYVVEVDRELTDSFLKQMEAGVWLEELGQTTRPCLTKRMGRRVFRIVLTQGLNRQIRRMCKALGYQVKRLRRERIVNIELGALPAGETRRIDGKELEELYRRVGMK